MWWHADVGKEVFLLLLVCFAFVCLFLQWHQWLRITSAMRNINGFGDNRSSLPSQKRISLSRKLLTSVLKIVIKTMKGCSSQLMASGDRVGRTQVSLRGFFKGHWEGDHVLMSIRATQIWLFLRVRRGGWMWEEWEARQAWLVRVHCMKFPNN